MRILLCLILLTTPVCAQTKAKAAPYQPCTSTIDQVQFIRGLRLGQPFTHLSTIFPQRSELFDRADENGVRVVWFTKSSVELRQALEGVDMMLLTYFDDSLVKIEIIYERNIKWQSNLHFASAIAYRLNLPLHGWLQRDPSYLVCQGFMVQVRNANVLPTLVVQDLIYLERLKERKEQIEARKRAKFRP